MWLAGWKYRRRITINNSLAYGLSDYQVWIPTSAFGAQWSAIRSSAQPTMADFRFTPSTATTTIPYWIDDNTTTPRGFWVRVSTIVAGLNAIYMYYGNSDATQGQNFDNTMQKLQAGDPTLKGLWRLDDGSGSTAQDISGNNNTGTLTNGPTWNSYDGGYPKFLSGYCVKFDGNDDYINVPNSSSLNFTNAITVECWVYNTGWNASNMNGYVAKYTVGDTSWILRTDAGNVATLYIHNGTTWVTAADSAALSLNTWYHLAGTFDGSNIKLYKNGVLVKTTALSGSIKNTTIPVTIGCSYLGGGANERIIGDIDEVAIYNRALSQEEIQCHYQRRKYATAEPTITSVGSEESAFFSTGTYKSSVTDTASKIAVSSISWNPSSQPTGTNLAVGIRVSSYPFSINSSTPAWLTVSNGQTLNWHGRYIQYQSTFTTTNSTTTPRLEDISITYRVKPWQEKSVTRTSLNSFGFGGGEGWTWQVPVKGGTLVTISAYIRYNTEYSGGTYDKPKLTLSGLGINESISATSSAENSWELRQLSGTPTSDGILTLKAEGFSTNPGGKFYIDDINISQ